MPRPKQGTADACVSATVSNRTSNLDYENAQFVGRKHGAALVDVDEQTIDKLIRSGQLRAFRVGRRVVIRLDELMRLAEANEIQ